MVIGAAALKVTGKGESREDVPKVQQSMESDRTDSLQFTLLAPARRFSNTIGVSPTEQPARRQR